MERGERGSLKRHDTRQKPSKVQVGVMIVSALFTLAVFGYAAWHAWTTPEDGAPNASILTTEQEEDGRLLVEVALSHPAEPGLREAEVTVTCGSTPAASPSLTFTNIPPGGRRTGWVACPAGTPAGNVTVAVTSWTPA